jgi:hypothetical protein
VELVLVSIVLVVAFCALTVLPTAICLRSAREREVEPLIGLFAGLLLSWVGVLLFVPALDGRVRVRASEAVPPRESFAASEAERQPVAPGVRGR